MDTKAVGARIKAARNAAHMTQEALAEKISVSVTHMGVIERGVKMPRLATFVTIANVLGVSADALLQDVVDKATLEQASQLSGMIADLPPKEQRRILKTVEALLKLD